MAICRSKARHATPALGLDSSVAGIALESDGVSASKQVRLGLPTAPASEAEARPALGDNRLQERTSVAPPPSRVPVTIRLARAS